MRKLAHKTLKHLRVDAHCTFSLLDIPSDNTEARLCAVEEMPSVAEHGNERIKIVCPVLWLLLEAFTTGLLDAVTVPSLKVFVGYQGFLHRIGATSAYHLSTECRQAL